MITRRRLLVSSTAMAAALASPQGLMAQQDPIRIGFGMALSGGLAAGGKSALLAYQIWAEEVNAAGGLLGRPVELVYYDDQSNPATVPGIYTKLLDIDGADIIVSGYATVPTAAAMPIVLQRKKLFMSLFALAANDKFNYPRYFSMMPTGQDTKREFSRGFFDLAAGLPEKPKTVAMAGADAEFSINCLEGARLNAEDHGIEIVYDSTYPPNTVDFTPIVRSIKAASPDLVYIASYPPDSAGMVRAVHEVGLGAMMLGGGMIGLQFASLKTQFGEMLNNIVYYDLYAPEPTMQFPGVEDFLVKYRGKAEAAGVDPLGLYIPPFAYAEMQILQQAIEATQSVDNDKLAEHIAANPFDTIVGTVRFGDRGEWAEARVLTAQFQNVEGNDVEQFKQAGKQVILHPAEFKSGELQFPFTP